MRNFLTVQIKLISELTIQHLYVNISAYLIHQRSANMSKTNFLSMPEPAFFNVILKDGVEQKTYFTHLSLELTFQSNNKLKLAFNVYNQHAVYGFYEPKSTTIKVIEFDNLELFNKINSFISKNNDFSYDFSLFLERDKEFKSFLDFENQLTLTTPLTKNSYSVFINGFKINLTYCLGRLTELLEEKFNQFVKTL